MNWKLPDPYIGYRVMGTVAFVSLLCVLAFGPMFGSLLVVMLFTIAEHLERRDRDG